MGLLSWLRRHSGNAKASSTMEGPGKTAQLPRLGFEELSRLPTRKTEDVRIYATEEQAKAAIRKSCKAVDYMIPGIVFSHIETSDTKFTYEVYKAPSTDTAMQFLRRIPRGKIPELYYIIVQAPDAAIGRDINGMFNEATGAPIT